VGLLHTPEGTPYKSPIPAPYLQASLNLIAGPFGSFSNISEPYCQESFLLQEL
jgi:hypothetical protein